ncbi:hypothetical protein E2C01_094060 [Portunus trituberculatus]|uniref:Uncharacterized protein n=1 Tax=Portunus trituberculatus TaxID=210409 RepID=A0A5B7JPF2_PORTR|nr:hypothetical protein [Portunus trituberculatus]
MLQGLTSSRNVPKRSQGRTKVQVVSQRFVSRALTVDILVQERIGFHEPNYPILAESSKFATPPLPVLR